MNYSQHKRHVPLGPASTRYGYQDFSSNNDGSRYGGPSYHGSSYSEPSYYYEPSSQYPTPQFQLSGYPAAPRTTGSVYYGFEGGHVQSTHGRSVQGQYSHPKDPSFGPPVNKVAYGPPPVGRSPYGPPPVGDGPYGRPPVGDGSYGRPPVGGGSYGPSAGGSQYGPLPVSEAPYGHPPYSRNSGKGLPVNRNYRAPHRESDEERLGLPSEEFEEEADEDSFDEECTDIGNSNPKGPPPPYKKCNPEEIIWYDRERITGGPPRKLFIYGLAPQTTKKSLKKVFGQYGKILRCEVIEKSNSDRYGFVAYPAAYMAADAMKQGRYFIDGKEVIVKPEKTSPDNSSQSGLATPSKKLFVGGLRPETDDKTLEEAFESWGEIENAYIMRQVTSKRSRGFGYILFKELSVAQAVFEKKPHMVDGIQVVMQYANPENVRKLPKKSLKKLRKKLDSKKKRKAKLSKFQKAYLQSQEGKGVLL